MKLNQIDNGNEFDFGKVSDEYSKYRDIYPKSMYKKLISFGIGKKGQQILDLGSGTAVLPINLYHTGADFTATDISENQVAYGQKLAQQKNMNINFKVCSAENTGFNDNQCFHYFDSEKAAKEIHRVLKSNGLFCKIFMDWLPYEDEKIMEMEQLVLKYNPHWKGGGFKQYQYSFPEWAENRFDIATIHSYNTVLTFTKEQWLGRIKSCRGVGASLLPEMIQAFENEYKNILAKYDEPLKLLHQIHIEIYFARQKNG